MRSTTVATAGATAEERAPLLHFPPATVVDDDEILPLCSNDQAPPPVSPSLPTKSSGGERLLSLDVFRGITVALMILVDDAGGKFPSINHAPWFGVTLADFVMPFFLFGVGVSIALVFKKTHNKMSATKKAIIRTIKLFILGVILQGGYFHGRHSLSYGADIDRIRWLGVLQRISIGYFLAALSEIWLTGDVVVDSLVSFIKKYYIEWILAVLLSAAYIGLLYGLYVPNWTFELPRSNFAPSNFYEVETATVHCGVRGSLGPPCNAVGFIDRILLGERHLYQHPAYIRTQDCSMNSPDYGPLPPNSPQWCLSPFDPEGILSSLMATVVCFSGLHFGHLIVHLKSHAQRMLLWSMTSFTFLLCGFVLFVLGMPFSKPLYTLSYFFLTTAVSGLFLALIYLIVDFAHVRWPFTLFQWMGMNALIVYILAACELFPVIIQGFYWHSPENNLVDVTESLMQTIFHSKRWGTLAFVILEILFWCIFAGVLHMKGIYMKL